MCVARIFFGVVDPPDLSRATAMTPTMATATGRLGQATDIKTHELASWSGPTSARPSELFLKPGCATTQAIHSDTIKYDRTFISLMYLIGSIT